MEQVKNHFNAGWDTVNCYLTQTQAIASNTVQTSREKVTHVYQEAMKAIQAALITVGYFIKAIGITGRHFVHGIGAGVLTGFFIGGIPGACVGAGLGGGIGLSIGLVIGAHQFAKDILNEFASDVLIAQPDSSI